jgi:hypothetical protein
MSLGAALNQLHPFQTRMSIAADDDVVVHRDAERLGNLDIWFVIWISACDGVGSPLG